MGNHPFLLLESGNDLCRQAVSLTHLNGEVMADLLLERKSEWTECFPVNRKVFKWPPEPIRFVSEKAILSYLHAEDAWLERKGLGPAKK